MHKRQATLELQLHTLVFFKNCSDLVLLGGRRFNIRGALQRGLELTDDIDYCEPISSWGARSDYGSTMISRNALNFLRKPRRDVWAVVVVIRTYSTIGMIQC